MEKQLVLLLCFGIITTFGKIIYKSDTVTESPCNLKAKPAANLQADWIARVPAWYVQMGSAHFFHTWIEKLTNQSGTPEQIMHLCLKLMYLAPEKPNGPYMVVAGGLNKAVAYKCHAKAPHSQACESVPGSHNYKLGIEFDDKLVATDNKHYALFFRCTAPNKKSWYVMTPSTEDLSASIKKEALIFAVKAGGHDKKYASIISYEKCPKPNVPSPSGDAIAAEVAKHKAQVKELEAGNTNIATNNV